MPHGPHRQGSRRPDTTGRAIGARHRSRVGAGLGSGLGGHAPRVGMAVDLAGAGEGRVAIQQAGEWTSPAMPGYYCREILARDSAENPPSSSRVCKAA